MPADNFLWFPSAATGGLLSQFNEKAAQPQGETTDAWFSQKNALEIKSFSFGITQAQTSGSASGGAGAGKAKFEEFSIEKGVDLASVPLYGACVAGAHFPSVMLVVRKAGGSNLLYIQYIFRMVFVTNISWNGGSGSDDPWTESVRFKFGAMGIQYIQQKADGTEGTKMQGMWNTTNNKPNLDVDPLPGAPSFLDGGQA
jgi:type VI secretion system secreted protein Hcp